MTKRLLFLCAQQSGRALLAASLRHRLWPVEDAPDPSQSTDERLAGYHRRRETLHREIGLHLRPSPRLAVLP